MSQFIQSQSALLTNRESLVGESKNILQKLILMYQKRQTRKQLAELPDFLLKDVGLNSDQVQREINKSFGIYK